MIHFVLKYYNKIPPEVLNFLGPFYNLLPEKVRFTPTFSKEIKEIKRIHSLSDDELLTEENDRLQKIIQYAYDHTAYYKELFDSNRIDPKSIMSKSDLQRIPFLTKEILVKNREKLISDEFKKEDLVYITTSGSTGVPTGFYVQKDSHIRDLAYTYYFFEKYGYTIKCKKLILRGKTFANQSRGKNIQWDSFKKELSINIFDMTDAQMEEYCKAIEKHSPDVAYGYMSAMYLLCKYIEKRGGIRHKFRCFIGISETITVAQMEYVERIIGAPVLTFYGMSERVIIAAQDHESGEYVPEPMYGITEIIDENGTVINEANKTGELVGTSLLNYGMPLIRYKTGDMSEWTSGVCLEAIEGRWNHDLLVGKDRCSISMTALNMYSEVFKRDKRYQLEQNVPGEVNIHIVPTKDFCEDDRKEIENQFNQKTAEQIVINSEIVDSISPEENGKLLLAKQNIEKNSKVVREGYRLKTIYGRKQRDILINCDGVPVSMASLEVHSIIYDYMTRYQFYQEEKGKVLVKVVLNDEIDKEIAKKAIEETFTLRTMGKINFTVEYVDALKPKANGKYSIIDQRMNVEEFI